MKKARVRSKARVRLTCFNRRIHAGHRWEKGDARLWCPGVWLRRKAALKGAK